MYFNLLPKSIQFPLAAAPSAPRNTWKFRRGAFGAAKNRKFRRGACGAAKNRPGTF
jgi:hypothetical protein